MDCFKMSNLCIVLTSKFSVFALPECDLDYDPHEPRPPEQIASLLHNGYTLNHLLSYMNWSVKDLYNQLKENDDVTVKYHHRGSKGRSRFATFKYVDDLREWCLLTAMMRGLTIDLDKWEVVCCPVTKCFSSTQMKGFTIDRNTMVTYTKKYDGTSIIAFLVDGILIVTTLGGIGTQVKDVVDTWGPSLQSLLETLPPGSTIQCEFCTPTEIHPEFCRKKCLTVFHVCNADGDLIAFTSLQIPDDMDVVEERTATYGELVDLLNETPTTFREIVEGFIISCHVSGKLMVLKLKSPFWESAANVKYPSDSLVYSTLMRCGNVNGAVDSYLETFPDMDDVDVDVDFVVRELFVDEFARNCNEVWGIVTELHQRVVEAFDKIIGSTYISSTNDFGSKFGSDISKAGLSSFISTIKSKFRKDNKISDCICVQDCVRFLISQFERKHNSRKDVTLGEVAEEVAKVAEKVVDSLCAK